MRSNLAQYLMKNGSGEGEPKGFLRFYLSQELTQELLSKRCEDSGGFLRFLRSKGFSL